MAHLKEVDMKLYFDLPEKEQDLVAGRLADEKILYCTPYDIDSDGKYTDGWMIITKSRVILIEDCEIKEEFVIKNGEDYNALSFVGSGLLEVVVNGEVRPLVNYSMSHVPRYVYMARILNDLRKNTIPKVKSTDTETKCPKCGRAYLRGTKVCTKCTNNVQVMKRLLQVAKPHWPLYATVILIFWIITAIQMIPPILNEHLVDDYLMPGVKNMKAILLLVVGLALCALMNTLLTIIRGIVTTKLGGLLSLDLKSMVFAKIQSLSLSYLDQWKPGDLMNRINADTNRIQSFIQDNGAKGVNQIIILVAVGIYLFFENWKLALFVFIPVPFVIFFVTKMRKMIGMRFRSQWKASDKVNSFLQDILSGIRVVKAFGQEKRGVENFRKLNREFADITIRNEKYWNTLFPIMNFILASGNFLVLYFGGKFILGNEMTIGELVKFTMYADYVYAPLSWLGFMPRWFNDAMIGAERIFQIIDEEPEIRDADRPVKHKIDGAIQFKNVSFGYKSYEPVLKNISIDVKKGEMIGLVGHSGAGKSTIINLLMRLYDVDEGEILIDGIDIRNISQADLRAQMGVVLQETFLFSGSIYENIIYAKPDATYEEVIRAAKIANAHDFIMKFPDGYDTKVGEKGVKLSGGERQRIAIARAIINDPKILILDEATASVDTETEQQIQEALGRLIKNRTTFAIAHRLSTLKNADRLMVIDDGRLAELGTHEELFRKKGIYHNLVMAQRKMSRMQGPVT